MLESTPKPSGLIRMAKVTTLRRMRSRRYWLKRRLGTLWSVKVEGKLGAYGRQSCREVFGPALLLPNEFHDVRHHQADVARQATGSSKTLPSAWPMSAMSLRCTCSPPRNQKR